MTDTVLVLNHFAAPPDGAGGTRHVELFGRLSPRWRAVVLAANRSALTRARVTHRDALFRPVWTTPVTGHPVSRVLNWVSFATTAGARGLRVRGVRVVYGSSPHLLAPLVGWLLAKAKHARFVLEVRDLWPKILAEMGGMSTSSVIYRTLEKIEGFLYRRADAIVVMAQGVGTELEGRGIAADKLVYIPNGADPADMATDVPRDELRRRYGFAGFVAVYAGAHGPANGLDLLLDAAREVAAELSDLHIVFVGDGIEKARLAARAATERIANVRFLDPIPKTEMGGLLAAADLGLHVLADVELFRYGVSPNKLFDYMAAGLPALTNTAGEVGELVTGAGAGLAVPPRSLAAGLRIAAAATPAARAAWGAAGRTYMEANQSRSAMARRLELLLERVVVGRDREALT